MDLCGHGTLSAAHLLYADGHVHPSKTIHFHTLYVPHFYPADPIITHHSQAIDCIPLCRSGVLVCRQETVVSPTTGGLKKLIQMDFPLEPLRPVGPHVSRQQVAASLGLSSADTVVAMTQTQTTDVMVHIKASTFLDIRPDLQAIAQIDARYA